MAFKASNLLPENAYSQARSAALNLRQYCQAKSTVIQASGMNGNDLLGIIETLKQASIDFAILKTTPGIAQYAKDQENDQTYDVATEFNALESLVNTAVTNLAASLPVDSNGYLLLLKLQGSAKDWRVFTPAQLAGIKSDLDAIILAVN